MGVGQRTLVAVKSVNQGIDSWSEDKFLPGDVIEQIRLEGQALAAIKPPFPGKAGLNRELRKLATSKNEKIYVRVSRQGRRLEISTCIVAEESMLRKNYALACFDDRNYVVTLMDANEEECALIQDQSQRLLAERGKMMVSALQMKDCVISYSWQQKMQHFLPPPNSAIVFSLLLMPFQSVRPSPEFNDVDDTSARAMAWLSASQKAGVPIIFVNIQTEPILRQGSGSVGFGVGSQEEALNIVNSGSYTIHDEPGSDIGILRGVRLWYAPAASETAFNLIPDENEKLGVGISHTEEGFLYVSSVEYGTAADRAGLKEVYELARLNGKLVVISRIASKKVTPWMVQSSGAIRCYDTLVISEILSLHKQSLQPIQLYVMLWNGFGLLPRNESSSGTKAGNTSSSSRMVKWEDSSDQSGLSSLPRPSDSSINLCTSVHNHTVPDDSSEENDFSFLSF